MPQPGGDTFAEIVAFLINDDDSAAGNFAGPFGNRSVRASRCPGNEAWIAFPFPVGPHIDERRTMWNADEARELIGRDGVD
ncbi:MAG: hypothetical protein FD139_3606 [Methylocystaceae bacterium]|nr:MAG: hypothetical protein FD172_3500 [Methylocystaceae bacterium]TXT42434.1 MAG: hypothetical protein FD139_3606 [Methylocystaceae bacterium]